jgi:hypothetical protein
MKILILLMSCNNWFFKEEEQVVKDTWLKPVVEGKYPEVDYYFYTTGETDYIDKENHTIYVNADDSWDATFYKTKRAFTLAKEQLEYDYIVRTNLSTYVNLKMLLAVIKFYLEPNNDKHIWGMELCNNNNIFYLIGKFLIFNKEDVDTIIKSDSKFDTQIDADDYVYGCVFNDKDKYDMLRCCNLSPRNASPINHTIIDDYLLQCLAISYRVYMFDELDNKYEHRKLDEFSIAHKIHNFFLSHSKLTKENFMECIKYKNEYCFYNGIGLNHL